ncbi:hypothetical protein PVK06_040420 [Gossypium arboreum]|uniref:Phytocyanin domain-containing protein n=1 Tax=Gossypium arboreum TaxID=29729 RepID=A0ABR0N5F6_GOSAR|nr:hypothetical protein PVK06_040420 [Gossypium arboreum]
MASNKLLMLSVVAIFLPAMAMATDYIVGDDSGWTINFDYQTWATDNVFYVGDKLAFKDCDIPPPSEALTSGNDTVVLKTPGQKWYICGVDNHCSAYGQKLSITVLYQYGWAPAPAPLAPTPISSSPSLPTPTAPSWPPAPSLPTTPAPTPEPWAPTTLSVPETTVTDPWAPSPISSPPSLPTPTAPSWPPAPSPYPWI